ncbi:MAG: hypothetical protein WDW38_007992 [Sanguina aurantia]
MTTAHVASGSHQPAAAGRRTHLVHAILIALSLPPLIGTAYLFNFGQHVDLGTGHLPQHTSLSAGEPSGSRPSIGANTTLNAQTSPFRKGTAGLKADADGNSSWAAGRPAPSSTFSDTPAGVQHLDETLSMPGRLGSISGNSSRLAILILLTSLVDCYSMPCRDRIPTLKTCVQWYHRNVMQTTPSDLYIFTHAHQVTEVLRKMGSLPLGVFLVPIPASDWTYPADFMDSSLWHGLEWNADYRMMGDWRLTHQMQFARDSGYRYALQTDDDSFVTSPISYDIVEMLQAQGSLMAARNIKTDIPLIMWGLPELAKYFIVSERLSPQTLYQHCDPPNIDGLHTRYGDGRKMTAAELAASIATGMPQTGGWDNTMLNGNFVVIDLEFWYQPIVQRFVSLCRLSGGSWRFRWNEQSVMAMVWQLFVPPDKYHQFDFSYVHGQPKLVFADYL